MQRNQDWLCLLQLPLATPLASYRHLLRASIVGEDNIDQRISHWASSDDIVPRRRHRSLKHRCLHDVSFTHRESPILSFQLNGHKR
jgi:hypothetical protein